MISVLLFMQPWRAGFKLVCLQEMWRSAEGNLKSEARALEGGEGGHPAGGVGVHLRSWPDFSLTSLIRSLCL